jgi:HAE1 family hydrophobic/amphiphilic exporter-1
MIRRLVSFSTDRPVTVLMFTLAVIAFGVVGFSRLALNLLPDINYPTLTVQTDFPDAAPQEVENLVTRPIEETVGVLQGLRRIHSVSRPGVSEATLEFAWGTDMGAAAADVREKLDLFQLPEGVEPPILLRFDPNLDPVMRLGLHGSHDLIFLRRIAEKSLKRELEKVPGIAAARLQGGLEEEIQIELDEGKLSALGISIQEVAQAVRGDNLNLPGGQLRDLKSQYLVRTLNEFEDVDQIAGTIIRESEGGRVRLSDVARVSRGYREREEIARIGGTESVEIALYKEGDANTVAVARELDDALARLRRNLPTGPEGDPLHLDVLFDQSRFIVNSVAEVRWAAILGGLLAVSVLYFFLRDVRSTAIIGLSIPVSIVATFIPMYRMDVTLNIMSLGGLALGIGMLVDNSIVVLESIFRHRSAGLGLREAAVRGTSEVGGAVVASTLTTVAVFFPIVFVEGIAGQLFRDQALTVSFSLLASLVVATTLIPMLASLGRGAPFEETQRTARPGRLRRILRFVLVSVPAAVLRLLRRAFRLLGRALGKLLGLLLGPAAAGYERMQGAYPGLLEKALARRGLVLGAALLLFVLSLGVLRRAGTELIPAMTQGEFSFDVTLPEGTPLQRTDAVLRAMEETADDDPRVGLTFSRVGSRIAPAGVAIKTRDENLGQLNVVLEDRNDRDAEQRVIAHLREVYSRIPDLDYKFGRPSYFSLKTPIEVEVLGDDLDELETSSERILRRLEQVDGLTDLRSSAVQGNPEIQIVFDRDRLASFGLEIDTVSRALRDKIRGNVATRFRELDDQIDIRVRNRETDRNTLEDIRNMVIGHGAGVPLKLRAVADVGVGRGPSEIHRFQQQRGGLITANLQGRDLGGAVAEIDRILAGTPLSRGVTARTSGQADDMRVSFDSLRFAMFLAVFLVYLVMASTFESLVHPFVIIFTVPLALVGVAAALLVTGTSISVIVGIGVVMLSGIVVNNAIVMIDRINQLRREGVAKMEAIVEGAGVRLRPILITTLTTILGLLPLALGVGEGAELRVPLAVTVIGGLLVATLLTLFVIPCVYSYVPSHIRATEEAPERAPSSPGGAAPEPTGNPGGPTP